MAKLRLCFLKLAASLQLAIMGQTCHKFCKNVWREVLIFWKVLLSVARGTDTYTTTTTTLFESQTKWQIGQISRSCGRFVHSIWSPFFRPLKVRKAFFNQFSAKVTMGLSLSEMLNRSCWLICFVSHKLPKEEGSSMEYGSIDRLTSLGSMWLQLWLKGPGLH